MSNGRETIISVGPGIPCVALPPAAGRGRDLLGGAVDAAPGRISLPGGPISKASLPAAGAGARCRLLGAGGAPRPGPMRSDRPRGRMTRDTRRITTQSASGFGR
jgi:hypothetical protein